MKELPLTNLDIVTSEERSNIRFPSGIQVEYGVYTSQDDGTTSMDFLRPFSETPTAIGAWLSRKFITGSVRITPQDGTRMNVELLADIPGLGARACQYIVIGRWK